MLLMPTCGFKYVVAEWMRKRLLRWLRLQEAEKLAQSQRVSEWQSWDADSGYLTPELGRLFMAEPCLPAGKADGESRDGIL